MLHPRGFEIRVITGDGVLEEYGTTMKGEDSVHCHIASQANQSFRLELKNHTDLDVTFRCFADGIRIGGQPCNPQATVQLSKLAVSPSTSRQFAFADVEFSESSDAVAIGSTKLMSLGTIIIKVRRIEHTRGKKERTFEIPALLNGPIDEKSKKIGTHHVILGPEIPRKASRYHQIVKTLDSNSQPFAKFVFKYRPREILQAQGIIPVTPDPSLEESNSTIDIPPSRRSNNRNQNPNSPIPGPSNLAHNATGTSPVPTFAHEIDLKPTIKIESNTGNDDEELALLEEQARLLKMQAENVQGRLNRIRARRGRAEKQQGLSLSKSTRGSRQDPIEVD
ncbi:hypothetical protein NLI96_g9418 [Meripilus lineatus]|uniref:DUF7918 domain-containing protein n=1 Tax=Meripilus lineatus TaxID=2056292 RepID=A0AAD5UXR8_9APHY|nr:hypothetical protein NLI96_g9418 [Physisporinus lineatus]